MEHLKIELTIVGDRITAISEAVFIAKATNKPLFLKIEGQKEGTTISVRIDPESYVQDIVTICELQNRLNQS